MRDAFISVVVRHDDLGWVPGNLRTDGSGRFEATFIEDSRVSLAVFEEGYVQPCALHLDLAGPPRDLEVDIEVVSKETLESPAAPRPSLIRGSALTGMVFETTATGRQPLGGADMWVNESGSGGFDGVYVARTFSDLSGHYFLCNLPSAAWLEVFKPGFRSAWIGPFDGTTAQTLDVELQRQ